MIPWHRNQIAAASLLVYLSSVLGGGLHHHDHGEACCAEKSSQLGSRPIEPTIQSGSPAVSTHEDADGCTLCTALHQAKALSMAISAAIWFIPVAEAQTLALECPIPSVCLVQQPRAPPPLS